MDKIPWDTIIGVIGTIMGTILGWWLGRTGRIVIDIRDVDINFFRDSSLESYKNFSEEKPPDEVTIQFLAAVFNRKDVSCSLSDCKVFLKYQDEKVEIDLDIFSSKDDVDELDKLFNINACSAVEARYNRTYTILPHPEKIRSGYKIYLQYKVNGGCINRRKIVRKCKWSRATHPWLFSFTRPSVMIKEKGVNVMEEMKDNHKTAPIHELAHIVQQYDDRIQPTTELGSMPINDDTGLEKEAEELSKKTERGSD